MFSLAGAWELTPPGRNPCRSVRRYRTRPRERFLSDEEFRRNDELLALLPKGVIAFPGSGITGNLVDKARSLGPCGACFKCRGD